jgi:hypothetical protein
MKNNYQILSKEELQELFQKERKNFSKSLDKNIPLYILRVMCRDLKEIEQEILKREYNFPAAASN